MVIAGPLRLIFPAKVGRNTTTRDRPVACRGSIGAVLQRPTRKNYLSGRSLGFLSSPAPCSGFPIPATRLLCMPSDAFRNHGGRYKLPQTLHDDCSTRRVASFLTARQHSWGALALVVSAAFVTRRSDGRAIVRTEARRMSAAPEASSCLCWPFAVDLGDRFVRKLTASRATSLCTHSSLNCMFFGGAESDRETV